MLFTARVNRLVGLAIPDKSPDFRRSGDAIIDPDWKNKLVKEKIVFPFPP